MKTIEYKVTVSDTLLQFLMKMMPDANRTKMKTILAHNVCVDGHRTSQFDFPLQPGMMVSVERADYKDRFLSHDYDLMYEDDYLFVINKHAGLLSNSRNPNDVTALTLLNDYLDQTHQRSRAHIVHRLDRETSGLMIYSKSKAVSRTLEHDWKGYVCDRAYVAVVWGKPEPPEGSIRSWLTDGPYCVLSSPVDNGGKEAITRYRTVSSSRRFALIELSLDTGRRNQIRVHLREMQHPVVHDPLYGYKDDDAPIGRLALHAFRLGFIHPITGKRLQFETPYPPSFMRLLRS